jgi:hypothetical protein
MYLQCLRGPSVPFLGKAPWSYRAKFDPAINRGWSEHATTLQVPICGFVADMFLMWVRCNRLNYPPFAYIMTLVCKFIVAILGVTSADAINGNYCNVNSTLVFNPITNSTEPADYNKISCGGGSSFTGLTAIFCLITTCSIKVYDTYNFYFNELPAARADSDDKCSDYAEFWSGCCIPNKNKLAGEGGLGGPLVD